MRRLSTDALANGWADATRRAECQSCNWTGSLADGVLPIRGDLYARVAPSEPMPSGECPHCGALAVEPDHCPSCGRYVEDHTPPHVDCPPTVPRPALPTPKGGARWRA